MDLIVVSDLLKESPGQYDSGCVPKATNDCFSLMSISFFLSFLSLKKKQLKKTTRRNT